MQVYYIPIGLLFFAAVVALTLAVFALQRRTDRAAQSLTIYQFSIALICSAYAVELMAPDLPSKTIWVYLRYFGWMLQLMAMPYFILWYIRAQIRIRRFLPFLFISIPIFFFAALLTNPLHHAYYTQVWLDSSAGYPMFAKSNGPLYWAYQIYAFMLYIGLAGFLLRTSTFTKHNYRAQILALAVGLLLPAIAEVGYLAGVRPLPYLNLLPFSYLLTGLVFSWAFFRFRSLEMRPVALDLTFNRIPSAILILDEAAVVTEINRAAANLLRITAIYKGGKRLEWVCSGWPELAAQAQAMRPGESGQIERFEGQRRQVYTLERTPIEGIQGERIGDLIIIREITRLVEAEELRIEQERALSALEEREHLARELHDGLGQVIGYLNLETQNALHLIQTGQIGLAQATLTHMAEVVGETQGDMRELLLGMRQEFSDSSDFYAALEKYILEFSHAYEFPIRINLPPANNRPKLEPGSEVHLLRVIQEALSNTRKHAEASQATIFFTFNADSAQVTIEDDGKGFDAGAPQSESNSGLHFGLNIMRERATAMNGSLQVISAPGQGTRIHVNVPLAHTVLTPPHASGWRVLIADDHPLFRDGLKNLLLARGVNVVGMAKDGVEAVEKALALKPDIAILDIQMPLKDGIQAASEIKLQLPETRILILTMAADVATLLKAFRAGASGYLLKDLKAEDFLVRLDALMIGETPLPAGVAEKLLKDLTSSPEAPTGPEELNERQIEILRLMASHLTYAQIGERLHLSVSTIKYHTALIMEKLQVSGRSEALAAAANRGLIERRKTGK